MPDGRRAARGRPCSATRELADTLERLGAEGAAPFYTGDVAAAVVATACARAAGMLTRADLAAYEAIAARAGPRRATAGARCCTNPPPTAGGILLAYALALLERDGRAAGRGARSSRRWSARRRERTPEFLDGLPEPGFLARFLASRLGSTTHISVLDGDGWACAVTCTNGEGSGVVVPGTGIHLNNMMGEQDLSPLGFFTAPAGPAAAVDDGADGGARATASPSSRSARRAPTGSARRSCR